MDANYNLGEKWGQFQGQEKWRGLLSPLDETLAKELIRNGKLVEAVYSNFPNRDKFVPTSKSKQSSASVTEPEGYDVQHHFFTEDDKANIIGFLGVSKPLLTARLGRIDIVIAFRGTVTVRDWFHNFLYTISPDKIDHNCGIAHGYRRYFDYLIDEVERAVKDAMNTSRDGVHDLSITFVGHSLGGALAVLCAKGIAERKANYLYTTDAAPDAATSQLFEHSKIPITVFSIGSPKVGNRAFRKKMKQLGVSVLRVVHKRDELRMWPPKIHILFVHSGVKLKIGESTALDIEDVKEAHSLDEYLACLHTESTAPWNATTRTNRPNEEQFSPLFEPLEDGYMAFKKDFRIPVRITM